VLAAIPYANVVQVAGPVVAGPEQLEHVNEALPDLPSGIMDLRPCRR
jgi:hypothetical protein